MFYTGYMPFTLIRIWFSGMLEVNCVKKANCDAARGRNLRLPMNMYLIR
jgi:hypothetical protein